MMIFSPRLGRLAALVLPALLIATGAQAHAHLTRSDPAADATVAAPSSLRLEFSEKLEPKFSGVSLMKASGAAIAVDGKVDGKTIEVAPKAPLAPGAYMVMWHAVADDGHKSQGSYNFTVK